MECKNCNEILNGKENFCSNCGQKNIEKLNIKYLLSEIVENVLNLDSKMFTTLKGLIFKPGFLTKEFSIGRRIRYVLPVRFYIIISILFFFLVSIIRFFPSEEVVDGNKLNASFYIGEQKISVSKKKYNELVLNDNIDSYITDSLNIEDGFTHFFVKQTIKAQNSKGGFGDVMLNQLSIFLLIFIPLISLVYNWSFIRNKYSFVDHVVFNVHFNSFVIVLLIFNEFIKLIGDISWWGILLVFFGSLIYLLIAIKRFYNRKWWVTLYKLVFLLCGYLTLAFVFTILLFLVSIAMN